MASNFYTPGSADDPNASRRPGAIARTMPSTAAVAQGVSEDVSDAWNQGKTGTAIGRAIRGAAAAIPAVLNDANTVVAQVFPFSRALKGAGDAARAMVGMEDLGEKKPEAPAAKPAAPTAQAAPATPAPTTPAPSAPATADVPTPPAAPDADPKAGITRNGNSFSGSFAAAPLQGPRDNFGNSTTNTDGMMRQLDNIQRLNAMGPQGPSVAMIPNSQNADTQQLFAKWANEALVKDMMSQKGGLNAAAAVNNAYMHGQNQLAGIGLQGQNRLNEIGMQGQNQLQGLDVQGRTQRDVAGIQGQSHLQGIDLQGRNAMDVANQAGINRKEVQQLENKGRLEFGKQQLDGNTEHKMNPYLASMAKLAESGALPPEQQMQVFGLLQETYNSSKSQSGNQPGVPAGYAYAGTKNGVPVFKDLKTGALMMGGK